MLFLCLPGHCWHQLCLLLLGLHAPSTPSAERLEEVGHRLVRGQMPCNQQVLVAPHIAVFGPRLLVVPEDLHLPLGRLRDAEPRQRDLDIRDWRVVLVVHDR